MLFSGSEVKTNEALAGQVAGLMQQIDELQAQLAATKPSADVNDKSIDEIFDKLNETIKVQENKIKELENALKDFLPNTDNISTKDYLRYRRRLKEIDEKALKVAKAKVKAFQAEVAGAKAEREAAKAEGEAAKSQNEESLAKLAEAKTVLARAQGRIQEQTEQLAIAKADLETFLKDTKIHAYIFEDIIFPKFQEHYEVLESEEADKVNNVKFSLAVKAAKKLDDKARKAGKNAKANKTVDNTNGYDNLVAKATTEATNYLDTLSKWPTGKVMVDAFRKKYSDCQTVEDIIKRIIEEKGKWNIKSMLTTREGLSVLVPVTAVVLGAIFASGAAIDNAGQLKTSNSLRATEITVSGASLEAVETGSREIFNDLEQANLINDVWGEEATPEAKKVAKTLAATREVKEDDLKTGYNTVNTAASSAGEIISYTEDGEIDPNCAYAQAKAAYLAATASKNTAEAEKQAKVLNEYISTLNGLKDDTTKGLNQMIKASSTSTAELQTIVAILNNPTAAVEFNASTLKQYGRYLSNPAKGGKATAVLSNAYTRDTGDVAILVECVDGKGNTYYNLVQYKLDAKLINMTVADMMEPLAKGNVNAKITSFDKDLVTENSGSVIQMNTSEGKTVSGLSSFTYSASATYNEKSDITKITAQALMLVTDAEGKVVGTNTVTISKNYAGKVSSASKDAELREELIKQVNQLCGENAAEDIVELV